MENPAAEQPIIARCSVCGTPLSARTMYYTDQGRPLCEAHAEAEAVFGTEIFAPHRVSAPPTQNLDLVPANEDAPVVYLGKPRAAFLANQPDLLAFAGLVLGVASLGICSGFFVYCVPVVAGGLSLYAFIQASNAYDPRRTRRHAILGMGGCALFALAIAALIAFYFYSIASLFATLGTSPGGVYYYPTPYIPPTPVIPTVPPAQF